MTEGGKEIEDRIAIEVPFRDSTTDNDRTTLSVIYMITETTPAMVVVEEILQVFHKAPITRTAQEYLPGALMHTAAAYLTTIPNLGKILRRNPYRPFAAAISGNANPLSIILSICKRFVPNLDV